jgi:hypothetical protein
MEAPRSLGAAGATPPGSAPGTTAAAPVDGLALAGIGGVFVGWFLTNTLVATLGSLQHGVRFYDMAAIIADPTRILFGVDAPFQRIVFGVVCLACLMGPLLPMARPARTSVAGCFAPLALMAVCGLWLYAKTSGDLLQGAQDPATLTGSVVRFANDLVHRGSGLVSQHVSVGFGAYLALAGSIALAVSGVRHLRAPSAPCAAP